ncbi:MAG: Hsp70 family protein [Anaerolineae bacterium]
MARAIGIDLGHDRSVVAAVCQGKTCSLPDETGSPFMAVDRVVGGGRHLQWAQAGEPVFCWAGDDTLIRLDQHQYRSRELGALYLMRLRLLAEQALGEPVGRAVLTVPVTASQKHLHALREMAHAAGLAPLRLVHQPLAALVHRLSNANSTPRTLLAFGFGLYHLDVVVVRYLPGAVTVLGLAGADWAGDELTGAVAAQWLQDLQAGRGVLREGNRREAEILRRRLHAHAETAKRALSIVEEVRTHLGPVELGLPAALAATLSREQYEEIVRPHLDKAVQAVDDALTLAGVAAADVDELLLLGGSTQAPLLRRLLLARLPHARLLVQCSPSLSGALGAAFLAAIADHICCPTCGCRCSAAAAYCGRCGHSLDGEERRVCRGCGLPNDPRRPVCWHCGASLRLAPGTLRMGRVPPLAALGLSCARCGAAMPPEAPACAVCGALALSFVGAIAAHTIVLEHPNGRCEPILSRGAPLPSAQPVCCDLRPAPGQRYVACSLREGDHAPAAANPVAAKVRVELPPDVADGTPVRMACRCDEDGLLEVSAWLPDGRDLEVDLRWD